MIEGMTLQIYLESCTLLFVVVLVVRFILPSLWTNSYFVSTVGSVSLETVKKYIQNQKDV